MNTGARIFGLPHLPDVGIAVAKAAAARQMDSKYMAKQEILRSAYFFLCCDFSLPCYCE